MVRTYSEENAQYLNYLLDKETWEPIFKQKSANNAYNEFLSTFQYYYEIAIPKKWVESKQCENKWITSGIKVSGNRLRFLNRLMKEGNISEEFKKYYRQYKKIYNKVISEAKKLSNNIRIRTSGNKAKAMWNLIKEELGSQKKMIKNIEININGENTQDPKIIANAFNDYTNIAQKILNDNSLSKNKDANVNAVIYNNNSMFLTQLLKRK
jgi:hypothetical protein